MTSGRIKSDLMPQGEGVRLKIFDYLYFQIFRNVKGPTNFQKPRQKYSPELSYRVLKFEVYL